VWTRLTDVASAAPLLTRSAAGRVRAALVAAVRESGVPLPDSVLDLVLSVRFLWLLVAFQCCALVLLLAVVLERRYTSQRIGADIAAALGVEDLPALSLSAAQTLLPAVERLHELNEELSLEAMYDELTGMYRRGAGMELLAREIARADRSLLGRLTVAFVDVNGLKSVNDSLGHAAGDELLRSVGAAIRGRLRANDLAFRYGGDEFVCVLPDADLAASARVMRDIARAAAGDDEIDVVTFGLAQAREQDTAEQLVARADAALYSARRLRSET
jgi:diguanylate cyclase (GGDEF)-like protein